MDKFEKYKSWCNAFASAIIALEAPFLYNYLNSLTLNIGVGVHLITILLAVLLVMLMEFSFDFLISNSRFLRKLILGRAYFEGIGVDITFDQQEKVVLYGALTRYYYKNKQLLAEAECFNIDGEIIGSFQLEAFEYDETAIKYGFHGFIQQTGEQNGKYYGYGEMRFGARKKNPNSYYGFYIDNSDCKQLFFEGGLLGEEQLNGISNNDESRRLFLKDYIMEFATRKHFKI